MFKRCSWILILVLTTLSAGAAELAGTEVVIPVIGRGPGAYGSEWRTDVIITSVARRNIEPPAVVTLTLSPSGAPEMSASFVLDPTASLRLDDVLLGTFGLTSGGGVLRVTTDSAVSKVAARARIYNVGASAGDYGVVVTGVPAAKLGRVQLLPALREGGDKRTNVGVANPTGASVLVSIGTYEEVTGEQRGEFTVVIPARSLWRWDDIFATPGSMLPDAATLRITSNEAVYAFASVVDNTSGDADFITGTTVPVDPQ